MKGNLQPNENVPQPGVFVTLMSEIVNVTQATFKSEVVESSQPVLVDFWAEWCRPCLAMTPILDELAAEFDGKATIAKVNIDDERMLGAMFQVMSIPALLVFKDGKKVAEFSGAQDRDTLRAAIEEQL